MSDGWRYLFVVLLWVIIQGCERQVADERLRCIDVLTSDNPQQSIVMLDSVDRGSLNEYNRHYYDLLTIKAIDKAFIQHTSDSLYLTVLDYFERHKNAPIYPEVLYYGGRVYSDMGDYPRALEFFQKTLSEIGGNDDKSDLRLNAMSQTGRLLNIMRLYDESLPYLKECVEVDSKIGDSTTLAYDYQLLATVLRNKEEYDAAERYLKKGYDLTIPDSKDNIYLQGELAILKFHEGETDSALALIRGIPERLQGNSKEYMSTYAARIYQKAGIHDTACYYASKAIGSVEKSWKRSGYKVLIENEMSNHNYPDSFLILLQNYLSTLESMFNENDKDAVITQNSMYNYSRYTQENEELLHRKYYLTLYLCLSISVILILIILFIMYKIKVSQQKTRSLISINNISELENRLGFIEQDRNHITKSSTLNELNTQLNEKRSQLISLLITKPLPSNPYLDSEGYNIVKDLIDKNECLPLNSNKWQVIMQSFMQISPSFWNDLNEITNAVIQEDEKRIIILIRYRMSVTQMAKLLLRVKGGLSYRRKNMCKRLFAPHDDAKTFDKIIQSI